MLVKDALLRRLLLAVIPVKGPQKTKAEDVRERIATKST